MSGYVDELERLPGAAGIKVFMGSSTGDLLVADDEGLNAILSRTRRRVSVHAEDEPRLRERIGLRREGDPSSHPVWRDETAALAATTSDWSRQRAAMAPGCISCMSRPPRRWTSSPATRTTSRSR